MNWSRIIRISFFLLLLSGVLQAQNKNILSYAKYLSDSTSTLSIDDISSSSQSGFTERNHLSKDFPTWIRIEVPSSIKTGNYCLRLPLNVRIELYYQEANHWLKTLNGPQITPSLRSIPQDPLYLCFPYSDSNRVFYIKVAPTEEFVKSLKELMLENKEKVIESISFTTQMSYALTGSMIIFVLCSLTLWFFLRDHSFALFAVFLVCFYTMSNKVFLSYLFGDQWPGLFLNRITNQLYFILNPLSLLVFSIFFFQVQQRSLLWWRVFNFVILLSLVCFATLSVDLTLNSNLILLYNVIAILIVTSYAAVAYYQQKFYPALYFLLGMGVPVVAASIIVLNYTGILPVAHLSLVADASILVLSFILSIGVIQRYRRMNSDLLNLTFTKLQKEHEAELFKLRNTELQSYNDIIIDQKHQIEAQARKLEEMNGTKDKLLSVLAHDLRGPVGNLNSILSLLRDRLMTPDEFHVISGKLKKDVEGTYLMLDEVLDWVKSQQDGIVSHPSNFDIILLANEVVRLASSQANLKQIEIKVKGPVKAIVYADNDHVHIILRNLLSNAIKFAPVASQVNIYISTENNTVKVTVEDNGIGMEADLVTKILSRPLKTHFQEKLIFEDF